MSKKRIPKGLFLLLPLLMMGKFFHMRKMAYGATREHWAKGRHRGWGSIHGHCRGDGRVDEEMI